MVPNRNMFVSILVALAILIASPAYATYAGTGLIYQCNNLCFAANNGVCDDGGTGSSTFLCPYGSDCKDCGMRPPYTRQPTVAWTHSPTSAPPAPARTAAPVSSGSFGSQTDRPATHKPTRSPMSQQATNAPNSVAPTSKPTPPTRKPTKYPTPKPTRVQRLRKKQG